MTTFYVTKYALTEGIKVVDGLHEREVHGESYATGDGVYSGFYRIGTDAHTSEDDARRKAEEMRVKKIEALRKQIAKLKKLTF